MASLWLLIFKQGLDKTVTSLQVGEFILKLSRLHIDEVDFGPFDILGLISLLHLFLP